MTESPHIPIMMSEVLNNLVYTPSGIYVDATIGFGGHSSAILQKINSKGKLIGIDKDPYALRYTERQLSVQRKEYELYHANYSLFPTFLNDLGVRKVNGFLFDLGTSSYQIDNTHRGFSFQCESELDMRFNTDEDYSAKDFLNTTDERELSNIIKKYSDELHSKKIAKSIIKSVKENKMNTTTDLKNAITSVVRGKYVVKSLARVFQSIRIHINDEMNSLIETLNYCLEYLAKGGRIVVITFHSIEDRIVKQFFKKQTIKCICPKEYPICTCDTIPSLKVITKKPITPCKEEIKCNPRARSSKLRVAERI